jgi:hypothetical protein
MHDAIPATIPPQALAAAALTSAAAAPAPVPAAAAPAAPAVATLSTVIALGSAITDRDGKIVTALAVREPLLGDYIWAEKTVDKGQTKILGNTEASIRLWSRISGLHIDDARKLKLRDAGKIKRWLETMDPPAQARIAVDDDMADLVEAPELEPLDGSFVDLVSPICDGRIAALPLSEPDIGLGNILEKLKGAHTIEAAIYSIMSGLTVPDVAKLCLRDLVAVRARVLPFLGD